MTLGERQTVQPLAEEGKILLEKSQATDLEQSLDLPERLEAPVRQGDRLGTLTVKRQWETVAEVPILAAETVERISWKALTLRLLQAALFAGCARRGGRTAGSLSQREGRGSAPARCPGG